MNRDLELQHLSTANEHVAAAQRLISEQTARIEKLRGHGHDTKLAEKTLRAFEASLQMFREHREVIIKVIEQIGQGT